MKTIVYKRARKQLVGDGWYVDMNRKDYDMVSNAYKRIGEIIASTNEIDRYLAKTATHGNKGRQTRREVIEGIIEQKCIRQQDYSTRQLDVVAEIYNDFADILEVDTIEFVDEELLIEAKANRYNTMFERLS